MSNIEELTKMGWSARCTVCQIPMERSRVHYGGKKD